jgi:CBS domain-containing protein
MDPNARGPPGVLRAPCDEGAAVMSESPTIQVLSLARPDPPPFSRTDTLRTVARAMDEWDAPLLAICTPDGVLQGVVERNHVLRAIGRGVDPRRTDAASCISEPVAVRGDDDLRSAFRQLTSPDLAMLPVTDHGHFAGMLHVEDVALAIMHLGSM